MATTHRSEDEDTCKWCHGKLSIIVSRDPDEEVDCVCTDPPRRVQLSRRKGWRKPSNTVVVSRPSRWGNPFTIGSFKQVRGGRREFSVSVMGGIRSYLQSERYARQIATDEFRKWLTLPRPLNRYNHHWSMIERHSVIVDGLHELRGKNLACWCPLDQPCHADVLLELANGGTNA